MKWSLSSTFWDSNGLLVARSIPATERANAKTWVASLRKQADFPCEASKAYRLLWKCDVLYEMLRRVGSEKSCGTLEEIARFQALWADICNNMDALAVPPTTGAVAGTDSYGNDYTIKGRLGEHTRATGQLVFERRRYYADSINDFEYHFSRNSKDAGEFFYYHPDGCQDFYARYVHDNGNPAAVKIFGDGRGTIYHLDKNGSPTVLHSTRVYAPRTTIGSSGHLPEDESDSETSSTSDTESEESSSEGRDEESDPSDAAESEVEELMTRLTLG